MSIINNLSAAVLENIKNKTMDSPWVLWVLGIGEKRDVCDNRKWCCWSERLSDIPESLWYLEDRMLLAASLRWQIHGPVKKRGDFLRSQIFSWHSSLSVIQAVVRWGCFSVRVKWRSNRLFPDLIYLRCHLYTGSYVFSAFNHGANGRFSVFWANE